MKLWMRFRRALLGAPTTGDEKLRLEQAVLCVDCETVSGSRNGHCIACGGSALLSLARLLGGSIPPAEAARLIEIDWWNEFVKEERKSA